VLEVMEKPNSSALTVVFGAMYALRVRVAVLFMPEAKRAEEKQLMRMTDMMATANFFICLLLA